MRRKERMEVQLYSFLALALDTGEYSACLNGSAAGSRAPGTQGIGGWVANGRQKIKLCHTVVPLAVSI
jgi:hypothetical protein